MDSNSSISTSTNDETITHDFPPFFTVYKDGRVKKYMISSSMPPGLDPTNSVESKDVPISPQDGVSARIFLPSIDNDQDNQKKLPLVIHYHGGGFCGGSPFDSISFKFLNLFASRARVVVLSVDYRLAPEHQLPIAYDDSWAALQWAAAHSNGNGPEPWLSDHVDFKQVFLIGESAGANIAHDVAIRASNTRLDGARLVGLIAVHPFFVGKEPDEMYKYMCPTSSGLDDDPRLNPGVDPGRLSRLGCERVLVCIAGKDGLKERGRAYFESLCKCGWSGKAELVETQGEDHCFHLFNLGSEKREPFLKKLVSFIHQDV